MIKRSNDLSVLTIGVCNVVEQESFRTIQK